MIWDGDAIERGRMLRLHLVVLVGERERERERERESWQLLRWTLLSDYVEASIERERQSD